MRDVMRLSAEMEVVWRISMPEKVVWLPGPAVAPLRCGASLAPRPVPPAQALSPALTERERVPARPSRQQELQLGSMMACVHNRHTHWCARSV